MDTVTLIRIVAGLMFMSVFIFVAIFYCLTLSRALTKCAPSSRTMEPGMVWLLLIPLVNLIWHFFVVIALAKTLGNEFRARQLVNIEPEPGKAIGIGMCTCGACAIIPILGILAGIAQFVLLIIYWAKIAGYSRLLDQAPTVNTASGVIQGA